MASGALVEAPHSKSCCPVHAGASTIQLVAQSFCDKWAKAASLSATENSLSLLRCKIEKAPEQGQVNAAVTLGDFQQSFKKMATNTLFGLELPQSRNCAHSKGRQADSKPQKRIPEEGSVSY